MKLTNKHKIALIRLQKAKAFYETMYNMELTIEKKFFGYSINSTNYDKEAEEYYFLFSKEYSEIIRTYSELGFTNLAQMAQISLFVIDANNQIIKNRSGKEFELDNMDKLLYTEE